MGKDIPDRRENTLLLLVMMLRVVLKPATEQNPLVREEGGLLGRGDTPLASGARVLVKAETLLNVRARVGCEGVTTPRTSAGPLALQAGLRLRVSESAGEVMMNS